MKETWKEKCQRRISELKFQIASQQVLTAIAETNKISFEELYHEVTKKYEQARNRHTKAELELKQLEESKSFLENEIREIEKEEKENSNN